MAQPDHNLPSSGTKTWRLVAGNLRLGAERDVQLAFWLLLALATGFLAYVARMHEITHDAFHEMSLFREALAQGVFPTQDVFAYTPTVAPAVHHEWGTGAVLYLVTVGSGLGLMGLSLLKMLLMASMWLLLYRVARMRGAHPYVFACLSVAVFPVMWVGFATVRAQLFTLVFIAAQLWMQELDWRGGRAWVLLWLLMLVVWLNLHAGFVVGLGLIALHGTERFVYMSITRKSFRAACMATWHLMLAAPVAVMSLQLNPYGWQYIPYLARAIRMPRPLIAEWQPLWRTHAPLLTLSIFAVSVFLFAYAQRHNRVRRLRGSAFLAICTYMTLKHIRHGSIFGVVWLAYVPAWISRTTLGKELVRIIDVHRRPAIRLCQLVVSASVLFACCNQFWLPSLPPQQLYSYASYPSGVLQYLKQNNFQGNLLTPFHIGAYVSWEGYPDIKVSLDGRYEVAYPEHLMVEHQAFRNGQGEWWKLLDKYPTDAALIDKNSRSYAAVLDRFGRASAAATRQTQHDWRIVYQDDAFLLLAAEHVNLPTVDRRGQKLLDGRWTVFSSEHGHWNRRLERPAEERSQEPARFVHQKID
jgi:hypothetical protein